MGWFSRVFGGAGRSERPLPEPSPEQLEELLATYRDVQKDEVATGKPADYAGSLEYISPARDLPGKWPGMPLCGCCSAPFSIDARQVGLWVAEGKKDGRPVPLCAVCVSDLNRRHLKDHGGQPFALPRGYDQVGQQLAAQYSGQSVQRIALVRIALVRSRRGR